jgi:hypothetical protein
VTTERKDVDLAQAERVADHWLALALRKLASDSDAMASVRNRLSDKFDYGDAVPVEYVIEALADHLEGA